MAITVSDLMANIEMQGEIFVHEYSHKREDYTVKAPVHSAAAADLMDQEVRYIYPLPDGKSLAIEVFAED